LPVNLPTSSRNHAAIPTSLLYLSSMPLVESVTFTPWPMWSKLEKSIRWRTNFCGLSFCVGATTFCARAMFLLLARAPISLRATFSLWMSTACWGRRREDEREWGRAEQKRRGERWGRNRRWKRRERGGERRERGGEGEREKVEGTKGEQWGRVEGEWGREGREGKKKEKGEEDYDEVQQRLSEQWHHHTTRGHTQCLLSTSRYCIVMQVLNNSQVMRTSLRDRLLGMECNNDKNTQENAQQVIQSPRHDIIGIQH